MRQGVGSSQEEGGIIENVEGIIEGQFFCDNHPTVLALCSSLVEKTGTFSVEKMLQPLSVNAFRFNQQALISYY